MAVDAHEDDPGLGVIYRNSGEQPAGHAAGLGHAAGIEGLVADVDEGNLGWPHVQAIKRLRPDFFRPGSSKANGNHKAEGDAERAVFVV